MHSKNRDFTANEPFLANQLNIWMYTQLRLVEMHLKSETDSTCMAEKFESIDRLHLNDWYYLWLEVNTKGVPSDHNQRMRAKKFNILFPLLRPLLVARMYPSHHTCEHPDWNKDSCDIVQRVSLGWLLAQSIDPHNHLVGMRFIEVPCKP